jgi:hypothetical protein
MMYLEKASEDELLHEYYQRAPRMNGYLSLLGFKALGDIFGD